ncbi:MAG: transcriptional repressor LexA [Halothiobacillaceae bacterium]
MTERPLTARQAEILDFIRQRVEQAGMPPTRQEICDALGFRSINAAVTHLRALERKGAITLQSGTSRGIQLAGYGERPARDGLAVIGRVAAGSPVLAEEHQESRLDITPDLFRPSADYLLRVRGMSMRDAGILDGDLVAVHRCQTARNGQIVVARLENEVTVKRFWREGRFVRLIAENPDIPDIELDLARQELFVEGVVVGVLRLGAEHV